MRPAFGDVETAADDLGTDSPTIPLTLPGAAVGAARAGATPPGALPAPRRAPGAGPQEPWPRRRAPARRQLPRDATGVAWLALGRCLWVAAVAALALAGCLPRLWDAARDQQLSAYHLVAVLAGGLALLARARPRLDEPDIHDRQIDFLVGLPLLVATGAVLTVLPDRFPDRFWTAHADLLALAPLVAGCVAVVFGTRALWRQRATLLVWPLALAPYPAAVSRHIAEALARPQLALAHLAGPRLGGWSVVSSRPGDLITIPTGAHGEVAFGAATRGLASGLAVLVLVLMAAAAAADRRDALTRVLVTVAGCGLTLAVRVLVAVVAGSAAGSASANAVLGTTGDVLTVIAMLVVTASLARAARAFQQRARGGEHPARGGGWRPARRAAVPRALVALAVLVLVCAGLAMLDVTGNRDSAARHPAAVSR